MFRAAIFDMDGLLIDSEPFWRSAEREVFGAAGIDITDEMAVTTSPMTTREVAEHWFSVKPWPEKSVEDMEAAVVARVALHIRSHAATLPGVREILALCAQMDWRVGLASNSPAVLCQLVLRELDIATSFQAVVSADLVECGKPDPAIYLLTAKLLDIAPADCLVFEDSPSGVRAARDAGMSVVAVSATPELFASSRSPPHLVIRALQEFTREHAQALWRAAQVSSAGS